LVDTTIFTALQRRASDIHIETRDDSVVIKFRIDGVLTQAMPPIGKEHHSTVISRIKVMSELDISERRVPQDGRFRVKYNGRAIDFRVSIMPSIHGEDAVLRVLDKESMSEKFRRSRSKWLVSTKTTCASSAATLKSRTAWCWLRDRRAAAKPPRCTPR
jgi:type IV pilus assembly protein PilB